jgi:PEP-CTERM motif
MKIKHLILLMPLLAIASIPALAGCIPYCNVGTIPPTNTFIASVTGTITGYFIQGGAASGGGAADLDFVAMLDVNTSTMSAYLFNNQTSLPGDTANFGSVTAGDTLVFFLQNQSLSQIFASQPSLSSDGINHAYATAFAGGVLNGATIPAGTYVGMEDLPACCSDFNYNDDSFVFVGVSSSTTPEPGTLVMLGSGILGLAGIMRRKIDS